MTSVVGGLFGGASAARRAGQVQAEAFEAGQERFAPFEQAGLSALEQQQALLGLGGQEAQQAAFAAFGESPGQQFLRERQQKALLRSQAAIGGLGGGNVRTALQQQATGFAQQDIQNQLTRLAQLSGRGQEAVGGIAGLLGQAGQARAGGILGAQQAQAGLAGQVLGIAGGAGLGHLGLLGKGVGAGGGALMGLFSDENMKHDVYDMSPEECMKTVLSLDIKAWRYLPEFDLGEDMHIGPMSQTAPECIKVEGKEMLDLHSELMLIAGALQYLQEEGLIQCH